MNWTDIALDKARRLLHKNLTCSKKPTEAGNFGEFATKSGLYFSFGDIAHFIHSSFRVSLCIREMKGAAGLPALKI